MNSLITLLGIQNDNKIYDNNVKKLNKQLLNKDIYKYNNNKIKYNKNRNKYPIKDTYKR